MSRPDALRDLVEGTSPDELPALAGDLAHALAVVLARTAASVKPVGATPPDGPDVLLTVEQAAGRMGVAKAWLYRHGREMPFTRKLGHRTLRFSARGVEQWLKTRPAA